MQPIEIIPIFTRTDDKRVNDFLAKQRLHQSLLRTPLRRKPLNISMARKGGNGRVRMALAVVALYLVCAAVSWGWVAW